jgi:hypothetical protein
MERKEAKLFLWIANSSNIFGLNPYAQRGTRADR